jgi:hypothetical protein
MKYVKSVNSYLHNKSLMFSNAGFHEKSKGIFYRDIISRTSRTARSDVP